MRDIETKVLPTLMLLASAVQVRDIISEAHGPTGDGDDYWRGRFHSLKQAATVMLTVAGMPVRDDVPCDHRRPGGCICMAIMQAPRR